MVPLGISSYSVKNTYWYWIFWILNFHKLILRQIVNSRFLSLETTNHPKKCSHSNPTDALFIKRNTQHADAVRSAAFAQWKQALGRAQGADWQVRAEEWRDFAWTVCSMCRYKLIYGYFHRLLSPTGSNRPHNVFQLSPSHLAVVLAAVHIDWDLILLWSLRY